MLIGNQNTCRYRNCVCQVCSVKGYLANICREKKSNAEKFSSKGLPDKKSNAIQNFEKSMQNESLQLKS